MAKTLYLVQQNLAGVLGPVKVKWNAELESYWSKDGNIEYHPDSNNFLRQEVFASYKQAKLFASGAKWFIRNLNERLSDNLEWMDDYD